MEGRGAQLPASAVVAAREIDRKSGVRRWPRSALRHNVRQLFQLERAEAAAAGVRPRPPMTRAGTHPRWSGAAGRASAPAASAAPPHLRRHGLPRRRVRVARRQVPISAARGRELIAAAQPDLEILHTLGRSAGPSHPLCLAQRAAA